jgi:hypothetical protein
METKKGKKTSFWKMDSWAWFSMSYACAVEVSLFMLLKDITGPSLLLAGVSLSIALLSLVVMDSYLRG